VSDSLRPSPERLLADWAARVRAEREQVERAREVDDPADFYAPVADRFRLDPRRKDDEVLELLLTHARLEETWLDVGAGSGRYALPLALRVREVIAVEPSEAMVAALKEDARRHAIGNIRVLREHWPLAAKPPGADVSLIAHIGYDIAQIGAFLDALEGSTRRLCVAVMGESAVTTVATLFWHGIHGEPRVRLPGLPELLMVLLARGRLPEVRLVDRVAPTFESVDEALAMARRQLWVREGSDKDRRLQEWLPRALHPAAGGRYAFDDRRSRIGLVTWQPRT
jgi:SAM-dependent methyltransferase